MRKVSELPTPSNPAKGVYCPICKEGFINDTDKTTIYCPFHVNPVMMMNFYHIETLVEYIKKQESYNL